MDLHLLELYRIVRLHHSLYLKMVLFVALRLQNVMLLLALVPLRLPEIQLQLVAVLADQQLVAALVDLLLNQLKMCFLLYYFFGA